MIRTMRAILMDKVRFEKTIRKGRFCESLANAVLATFRVSFEAIEVLVYKVASLFGAHLYSVAR